MAPGQPIVLPSTTPPLLLNSILTSPSYPTTLLICSSREAFLSSLLDSLSSSESPTRLLTPTLHTLSLASHIQVIYTPTLSHLRAWLAIADKDCAAPAPPAVPGSEDRWGKKDGKDKKGGKTGKLVVWRLVKMHEATSDWSVQGLSATLAALVEAGRRMGRQVVLNEAIERDIDGSRRDALVSDELLELDEVGEEDEQEEVEQDIGNGDIQQDVTEQRREDPKSVYAQRLPMLNGSSRREGLDESGAWSGRTVEVGVVLRRWFRYVRDDMM